MNHIKWYVLLGMLVMGSVQANELDTLIKRSSGIAEVTSVTVSELQLLKNNLKSEFNGKGHPDWQALAMQAVAAKKFTALQELPTAKHGRGFFALTMNATNNWLLQAPHGDSDLYTGKIASQLFLSGEFKAAQWNTVKRAISDMAHTPDTYWQAFTQAFAEQFPDGKIIQLHGYDQDIRKTEAGESSDMILSAGHETPPPWILETAVCFKKAFPKRVSLYPYDVHELGGTTNVQGQLLRSLGHNGFLHIEISKTMRKQMLDKADTRKRFIKCL